jgi:hypothetical protein
VDLFDAAGRRVMTARMKCYRPIDVSELDDPPDVVPVMPTQIEIVANPFPGVKTFIKRIHLVLSEMTAEDKWERSACDFEPPAGIPRRRAGGRAGGGEVRKPPGGPGK